MTHRPKLHRPTATLCLPLAGAVLLSSCAEVLFPLQGDGRRQKVYSKPPDRTEPLLPPAAVRHPGEVAYLKTRRRAAKVPPGGPVIGVALSGGGVRSANFNLGTLQGLEDAKLLAQVDYLSCVSGGGYIGGWYVSHLRTGEEIAELKALTADGKLPPDFSSCRRDLLNLDEKTYSMAVPHVRERGGIFGHGRTKAWTVTRSTGHYLATLVPNLIQDLGIHLHPAPGKWNALHPIYPYRRLLVDTYLQGWEKIRSDTERPILGRDINSPGSETPIFISCGALGNSRNSRSDEDRDGDNRLMSWTGTHHFEFTRFWCGSPLVGWIPTSNFDRTVADVKRSADGMTTEVLAGAYPIGATAPFKLSSAMAASGAALDSSGTPSKTRQLTRWFMTALNANLRYQTSNFAQDRTEWYARPLDRLRETTTDRFNRSPRSNVLQISDGGHFDNLGVFALLRRQVDVIYAFDATKDPKYQYGDLQRLLALILDRGWEYELSPGRWHRGGTATPLPAGLSAGGVPGRPVCVFKVKTGPGTFSEIHYIKNSYRGWSDWNDPLAQQKPTLFALSPEGENRAELQNCCFPHVGTMFLTGWGQPKFDAYRDLGRLLARKAAAGTSRSGSNRR